MTANNNNNYKTKLLSEQIIPVALRRNRFLPFTQEDQTSWERMFETSFCVMLQNPEYRNYTHETLLKEAEMIANYFVNASREKFIENNGVESNTVDDAFGPEVTTGVFPIIKKASSA